MRQASMATGNELVWRLGSDMGKLGFRKSAAFSTGSWLYRLSSATHDLCALLQVGLVAPGSAPRSTNEYFHRGD